MQEFKKQNTTLLTQAAAEDAPDWTQSTAPSIVVRPGINLATPRPSAADVLFSCAGRSYQLKLNNCVKLPGLAGYWVPISSSSTSPPRPKPGLDRGFPRRPITCHRAKETAVSELHRPDGIRPHRPEQKCVNPTEFLQHANENFVLVKVDFPRNKPQADPQREANQILERAYRVLGFPTVLVLEANGTKSNA